MVPHVAGGKSSTADSQRKVMPEAENVQPVEPNTIPETPPGGGNEPPNPLEAPEVEAAIAAARAEERQKALGSIEEHLPIIASDEYKTLRAMKAGGKRIRIADADEAPEGPSGQAPTFDEYFDNLTQSELIGRGVEPNLGKVVGNYVKSAVRDALNVAETQDRTIEGKIQQAVKSVMSEMGDVRQYAKFQQLLEEDAPLAEGDGFRIGVKSQPDLIPAAKKILAQRPHLSEQEALELAAFRKSAPDFAKRVQEATERAKAGVLPAGVGPSRRVPFQMPDINPYKQDGTEKTPAEILQEAGIPEDAFEREVLPSG